MRASGRSAGVLLMALVAFSLLLGLSAQALAADNWFNAAGPLSPGASQAGAIDTVGDVDWYCFYTSRPGEVKIGINRTSDDTTRLDLFRWDGGKFVSVDNTNTGSSSPLAVSAPAGLYYVMLKGWHSDYVGG
jgi:hypothetical protein